MLLAGAMNTTYAQIYDTLGLNISHLKTSALFSDYLTLIGQLNKNNLKVLTVGAALAIQKNFALNEAFIDNITATFGAQVFVEDFSGNASSSTTQIDNWVSDETHTDIVPLFNGLYLFLPPVTFNGSAPISSLITSTKLEAAIASMKPETVDLTFPQFNTTSNLLNAETVLSKLGIVDAFTGSADFFAVNGDYNLRLSEMIDSKVVFKLSQLGTEVSAASGLILSPPEKKKKENKTLQILPPIDLFFS
ncbi:serpin [Tyrophagus putrescentiae]|nr:serpin [Tyrophagus putrescentiae]